MTDRRVALLRGVNVGTSKRIAMADLRALVEKLGYTEVSTLLNSGNAVFTVPRGVKGDPGMRIEKALADVLELSSKTIVLKEAEVATIVDGNPFTKIADNPSLLFVMVLGSESAREALAPLLEERWAPEAVALGERCVYYWCPAGSIDSPLAKAINKAVKDRGTSRNIATMTKLAALTKTALLLFALTLSGATAALHAQAAPSSAAAPWPQHSKERPMARVEVAPAQKLPAPPPADAIILFNGRDLSNWQHASGQAAGWRVVGDGSMEVVRGTGDIVSKEVFGDVHLYVEWATPSPAVGTEQNRGNSGVFLMGRYEVQVLDSYMSVTYADGQAGAIYGQFPPLVNVSRAPGEWQSFDIEFYRPRFDAAGKLVSPARMIVHQNGVLIHDNVTLMGPTSHMVRAPYEAHADALPIRLQDHGHPVRFRNIWLHRLEPVKP